MAQRGNIDYEQIKSFQRQGNGNLIQMAGGGTKTNGHVLIYDANGNAIDGGSGPAASVLTTKGDLLTYNSGLVRLPIGTNGQVLTANSAATDGVDWETPTSGSGSYFPIPPGITAPPSPGTLTWVNQGSAAASTVNSGINMTVPAQNSDNLRMLVKAIPATPYTFTVGVLATHPPADAGNMGICITDGTGTPKIIAWTVQYGGGGFLGFQLQQWNSPTSFNSVQNYEGRGVADPFGFILFRVLDDGSNLKWSLSKDGINWVQAFSAGRAAFLTPADIGLMMNTHGNVAIAMWVGHWTGV